MTSRIDEFAEVASEFCAWAEGPPLPAIGEAHTAVLLLSALYRAALHLPVQCDDRQPSEVSRESWQDVYRRFGALPFNYYMQCLDPQSVPAEEVGVADLADDLADIWRDLKAGLMLFNAGHVSAAVREWRQGFWQHWGRHAAGAIFALHCWLSDHAEDAN